MVLNRGSPGEISAGAACRNPSGCTCGAEGMCISPDYPAGELCAGSAPAKAAKAPVKKAAKKSAGVTAQPTGAGLPAPTPEVVA